MGIPASGGAKLVQYERPHLARRGEKPATWRSGADLLQGCRGCAMAKGFDVSPAVRQGLKSAAQAIVAEAGGQQAVIESVIRAVNWLETAPGDAAARRMTKAELLEAYSCAIGVAEELYRAAIVLNAITLDGGMARTEVGTKSAGTRWARLESVKDWAFQQRLESPQESRASVIKRILPEVRQRAKEAGEPLTGGDAALNRTVTDWFRGAGIR